jgi:hypothetical protein
VRACLRAFAGFPFYLTVSQLWSCGAAGTLAARGSAGVGCRDGGLASGELRSRFLTAQEMARANEHLAMFFYTSNTPPQRANNPHLKQLGALLGFKTPSPKELRGRLLKGARSSVEESLLTELDSTRYAITTDGWSKRTAIRGAALINVMLCPDDGPAVFWDVIDASGAIKDADYIVKIHKVSKHILQKERVLQQK